MSSYCQVTGRSVGFGNNVSHSHRRTRRMWRPNVHRRRFWLPAERRHVILTVSARGLRVIDRDGIEAVVARLRARGERV